MAVELLDIVVLVAILVGSLLYFTKGTLWSKPSSDDAFKSTSFASSGGGDSIAEKLQEMDKNVIFFFGSQTGTGEDFAARLSKEAGQKFGLKAMKADLEEFSMETLDTIPEGTVVGFVMATYGEGEPTDNASQFWELINDEAVEFSKGGSTLENLSYVIFGLGNNTYEHFNKIGRDLDKRLTELGAKRIGPYGEGDDGKGTMEEDYLAWKDDMFSTWKDEFGLEEHEAVYEPSIEVVEKEELTSQDNTVFTGEKTKHLLQEGTTKGPYGVSNPYPTPVVVAREVFNAPDRNCIHMEFDISGSNMRYTTGDHLAYWCQNSNSEVKRFLEILGLWEKKDHVIDIKVLDSAFKVPFPTPTTYDTVVRYYLEINGPVSRQFVSSIAPFAPGVESKKEAIRLGGDKAQFADEVTHHYLNTARLLHKLSKGEAWTKVPFSFIIESMQHLQPRYYSISSSSLEDKNKISITAVVESIAPKGSDHVLKGVATNYILDIKNRFHAPSSAGDEFSYNLQGPKGKYVSDNVVKVPVHIRHSTFKLPTNPQRAVIMVGPGTGVAPFRGFIRERALQAKNGTPVGPALLFFGSRHPEQDNLYADEWEAIQKESDFLKVFTAFSRVDDKKVYVQNRLEEQAKLVNDLLADGAFFYVCGDANRMARDVQRVLSKIISEQRDIPLQRAEEIVKSMKTQNTYQEDVW